LFGSLAFNSWFVALSMYYIGTVESGFEGLKLLKAKGE